MTLVEAIKEAIKHAEGVMDENLEMIKEEAHCNYTDAEIAKSFIEDVEAVKDLLPRTESEERNESLEV